MIKLFFSSCKKNTEHDASKALAEDSFYELYGRYAVLCHDDRGKPYFEGEDSVYVSISHSAERCLAVISDIEVGCDIEFMKGGRERLVRLAERYFTETEAEYVRTEPDRRFYEVWCKKESYVKLTGEGLSRCLNSFSVFQTEGVEYSFHECDGYAIAVCTKIQI